MQTFRLSSCLVLRWEERIKGWRNDYWKGWPFCQSPKTGSLAEWTFELSLLVSSDNPPERALLRFSCFCSISLVLNADQSGAGKRFSGLYGYSSFQESGYPNAQCTVGVRDSRKFAKLVNRF